MKWVGRALGVVGLGVLGLVLLSCAVLVAFFPRGRPASAEKVARTSSRQERGRYLAEHQLMCVHCHSEKDSALFARPVKRETAYAGGECFDEQDHMDGIICPPNITPDADTGIGAWTDGEILRALREGLGRDGHALFPVMPYEYFAALSDEDARALVVYLRSLPPVRKVSRRTELPFWLRLMVRISPRPLDGSPNPPTAAQPVPYGQFLANVALCAFCHTPEEPIGELGKPAFAGGYEFYGPGFVGSGASAGRVVTPNLTPDPDTGLGEVPREAFIGRFKSFAQVDPEARADPSVRTAMPWRELSGMTEEDLGAIYDYLRTVKPVSHRVVTRPDP